MVKRFSISRLGGQVLKEISFIRRDHVALIVILLIPTVVIFAIRYGKLIQIVELPQIGIIDDDDSEGLPGDLSRDFVLICQKYQIARKMDLFISDNETDLSQRLGKGSLNAYIILHDGFEYNLSIHWPTIVTVVIDSLDLIRFSDSQTVISDIIEEYRQTYNFTGVFDPQWHIIKPVEGAATGLFDIAPFFFPWMLFSIASLVASQSIIGDVPKDRMALTPTNKFEIYMAKVLGIWIIMSLVTLWECLLSMAFGFVIRSDFLTFFALLSVISLAGVTIGLMLSAFANSPLAALQLFIFFFLAQAIIVFFIPAEQLLRIFPVYNGQLLMTKLVIRGQDIMFKNTLEYAINILAFIGITWISGYLAYKRQKILI